VLVEAVMDQAGRLEQLFSDTRSQPSWRLPQAIHLKKTKADTELLSVFHLHTETEISSL
jgi:hypothetical protein